MKLFKSVVLKVGAMTGKWANRTKRAIEGQNNTKGAKTLNHYHQSIIELSSVSDHSVNFGCDLIALKAMKPLVDS